MESKGVQGQSDPQQSKKPNLAKNVKLVSAIARYLCLTGESDLEGVLKAMLVPGIFVEHREHIRLHAESIRLEKDVPSVLTCTLEDVRGKCNRFGGGLCSQLLFSVPKRNVVSTSVPAPTQHFTVLCGCWAGPYAGFLRDL